ncbi:hypothetical protein EBZ80_15215 [bacterium]|nr:hypothetical protein [Betaproteobacteria bacterium]NDE16274.1 hypothetical protein [bacterium]
MTHSALGDPARPIAGNDSEILSADWYQLLTPAQKIAYTRYQYIYLNDRVADWDAHAHVRRRLNWDGGKDNFGVKHTPIWGKIVRAAESAGADLGSWVYAHFSAVGTEKIATNNQRVTEMRPSMLYAANSPQIYREYMEKMPTLIEQRFHVAMETMNLRLATTAVYKMSKSTQEFYVLCDEGYVSASPFFRHAMAAKINCDKAVERYLWFAALEYEAQQRSYDAVMEKHPKYKWWVENEIRSAVVAIRQHWRENDAQ